MLPPTHIGHISWGLKVWYHRGIVRSVFHARRHPLLRYHPIPQRQRDRSVTKTSQRLSKLAMISSSPLLRRNRRGSPCETNHSTRSHRTEARLKRQNNLKFFVDCNNLLCSGETQQTGMMSPTNWNAFHKMTVLESGFHTPLSFRVCRHHSTRNTIWFLCPTRYSTANQFDRMRHRALMKRHVALFFILLGCCLLPTTLVAAQGDCTCEAEQTTLGQAAGNSANILIARSACDPTNSTYCELYCGVHGTTYLQEKCCLHAGKQASLLAFEEDSQWIPRLEEFNRCTGANVRLEYLPEGEDGMADALERDVGTTATSTSGEGIFDAYIVQAPWCVRCNPELVALPN